MQIKHKIYFLSFIIAQVLNLFSCENKNHSKEIKQETTYTFPDYVDTTKFLKQSEVLDFINKAPTISINRTGAGSPFDKLNFNKVIAYDYEGLLGGIDDIDGFYTEISKSVYKQKALTEKQTNFVISEFTNKANYGDDVMKCFEPHMSIVFFNDDKVVNVVEICLDCNYLNSTFPIPNDQLSIISDHGFTPSGKRMIINISKELGFRYGNITDEILKELDERTKIN